MPERSAGACRIGALIPKMAIIAFRPMPYSFVGSILASSAPVFSASAFATSSVCPCQEWSAIRIFMVESPTGEDTGRIGIRIS